MLIAATLVALAAPGVANAQNPILRATVGPAAVITMTDAAGVPLSNIPVGTYDIVVSDRSVEHNFHLSGPGVNQSTTVGGMESLTWTVTLGNGVYRFVCDPHATEMFGSFTVGTGVNPPPPPAPPPPPPPPPPAGGGTRVTRLNATVGPGFSISLRTTAGRRVTSLRRGRYRIVVNDRSRVHNFHLTGPRVNKKTTVGFRGRTTWTLTLRRGTYRFVCDPHRTAMRGSVRVR
jgi:plastocyanin